MHIIFDCRGQDAVAFYNGSWEHEPDCSLLGCRLWEVFLTIEDMRSDDRLKCDQFISHIGVVFDRR